MKRRLNTIAAFLLYILLFSAFYHPHSKAFLYASDTLFIREQISLDHNRIFTWIQNTGTFNQNIGTANTPGFIWPKGTLKTAIFTSGICIAGYVNGNIRMGSSSYWGEFRPGTINISNGISIPYTDSTFKFYKVSEGDNCNNNLDWANWGLMIPYGAPYTDKNGNFQYDPCIDIPGIHTASQTVFICMTDGFLKSHNSSEGFGGGTLPLNSEVRLTAWTYGGKVSSVVSDAQFLRWQIINKNESPWESTKVSIVCDPDIGDATDDNIGCDSVRQMGYCYNSDNEDGVGNPGTYGSSPPAVGMRILRSIKNKRSLGNEVFGCTSFCYFRSSGSGGPVCESDPYDYIHAYNYMDGYKRDGTKWINPVTFTQTKFTFSGNPENGQGWTEYLGKVDNCGSDSGSVVPSPGGDKRFILSVGRNNLTINPYDTVEVVITQLISRGVNHLNSVTKLLHYSDGVKSVFDLLYVDDNPVSSVDPQNPNLPTSFYLSNNFPNPFNPTTKITYGLPYDFKLEITVYDILGNEVAKIFDGTQKGGNYTLEFDGSNLSSGIYFLKFKSGAFIVTRKMMLLK